MSLVHHSRCQMGMLLAAVASAFISAALIGITAEPPQSPTPQQLQTRDEVERTVLERTSQIEKESNGTPRHEWAGIYAHTYPSGAMLAVAPNAGATFQMCGCFGVHNQNIGTVSEKDGRVSVRWNTKVDDWNGPESIFVLVRWGDRRYLVEEGRILAFCHAAREPRDPSEDPFQLRWFFWREGGQKLPLTGEPVLPNGYQKYLKMDRIKASILSTLPSTTTRHAVYPNEFETVRLVVKLNSGSAQHVLPSMDFGLVEPNEISRIRVLRVREHECDAEVWFIQKIGEKAPMPKVGAKVISG